MRRRRSDSGFSLAALIFFASAASILIAAAVPSYQMQAKRELEAELIFRGEEYARAIQKYQRRFGIYPALVEQLVSTNGLRFLRRPYKDPITGEDFRLITINPDGSVNGSKLFTRNLNTPLFGNTPMFGQQGQTLGQGQIPGQGQNAPGPRGSATPPQGQPRGFEAASQQTPSSRIGGVTATSPFGGSQTQASPQGQQRGQPFSNPFGGANASSGTPTAGGGIIGVASNSEKESMKVYNNRQKYDEWEFIAILGQQGQPGQQQNPQQPNQANQPNQQFNQPGGGQRPNNPFQNTPLNPFGGQPGGSPFGPAPGAPVQNPFGPGNTPQQPPVQPRR